MPNGGEPSLDALQQEYASANDAYLHYDSFSWQVGSVLVAGVFVFWGFLLQERPEAALFLASALLVSVMMSAWALYADHNRQIYLQKLDRLHELEQRLGLEQHLRWVNGRCRTFGPRGHELNLIIYTVMCIGAPLLYSLTLGISSWLSLPLIPVPVVLIWIRLNERALKAHRQSMGVGAARMAGDPIGDSEMANGSRPPDESEDEYLARISAAHEATIKFYQLAWEASQKNNHHEDTLLTWFVALATGGILLSFQIPPNYLPSSAFSMFLVLLPWVATALVGITARLLMRSLMHENETFSYKQAWELTILPLRPNITVPEFAKQLMQLVSAKDPKALRLTTGVSWMTWTCVITFGIGVIALMSLILLNAVGLFPDEYRR